MLNTLKKRKVQGMQNGINSIEILSANLQIYFNERINNLFKEFNELFFDPAIKNIKENTNETITDQQARNFVFSFLNVLFVPFPQLFRGNLRIFFIFFLIVKMISDAENFSQSLRKLC